MDVFTKEKRSQVMSAVKSKDTKPEMLIRKALFKKGFRYSLHNKKIAGKPDIYLKKYNAVIFIHGCFWHGHDCKAAKLPQTNTEFWQTKIEGNKKRDSQTIERLRTCGFKIAIVWGCALKGKKQERLDYITDKITEWLKAGNETKEIILSGNT